MMDARRNGLVLLALLLLTQTTISAQTDSMGKDVPVDSVSVATSDSLQTKRSFFKKFLDYFNDANKEKKNKKFDFSVIGGPHYSSDTKFGLGLVAAGLYRTDRNDSILPPSNVSLYGDVSTVGFYLLGVRGNHLFPQEKYRLNYNLYFYSFPSLYWGRGYDNGANSDNESDYKRILWILSAVMLLVIAVIISSWIAMRRVLLLPLEEVINHIRAIAAGDLTQPIQAQGKNEMAILARNVQEMQTSLANTVGVVREGADTIYTGAGEISAGSNDLSSRTEQQAASLEETAASMEQLTATVKQNADNARQASRLALDASSTAKKGGNVVEGVVRTMDEIATSSSKIAQITNVIDGIAFQTNILALNAAVEAARAGEQGRGFAVVAGEVRTLAQRSAQAAKEIKALIDDSGERVNAGSQLVNEAGATMAEIVNAVTRVTDIMGEIASASDEQSRGIDQVGQAVAEMDRVTQQNASLVEESAAAAAALEDQAARLNDAVAVFKITRNQAVKAAPVKTYAPKAQPVAAASEANWETF